MTGMRRFIIMMTDINMKDSSVSEPAALSLRSFRDILRQHMELYGYELIDIPIIQPAEVFLTKAGDKIISRLLTFERQGQQYALRPEFTAAAAARYLSLNEKPVVRWQFSGPIFADDPHSGTQMLSMGAELIGLAGSGADAEIISMAAQGLLKNGLANWSLILGHVGLMLHLLGRFQLDSKTKRLLLGYRHRLKSTDDKTAIHAEIESIFPQPITEGMSTAGDSQDTYHMLDTLLDTTRRGTALGGRTRQDIALRLMEKRLRAAQHQQISEALDFLLRWVNIQGSMDECWPQLENLILNDPIGMSLLDEWRRTIQLLGVYGIPQDKIVIQPDLARDWDYYTGIVFGLSLPDGRLAAAGGRYDELIRLMGGRENAPAVGFAYYMHNLDDSLQAIPPTTPGMTLIAADESLETAVQWAKLFRAQSRTVCINPEGSKGSYHQMIALPDGSIRFGDNTFRPDEVENLLSEMDSSPNA